MAKIIPGIITISGTLDNNVHVKKSNGKNYVRKKQQEGVGKNRPAIVKQNSRTALLNSISGSINRVVKNHDRSFHQSSFYSRIIRGYEQSLPITGSFY